MSDFESVHQLAQATASNKDIPDELTFAEVIKNRTAPPCSLSNFMDYLYYVEHNAEPLQFFLWYCDYIHRWSSLLPRQKALAPVWDPARTAEPRSRFITYSHKRARSLKMSKIISIMEMNLENETSSPPRDEGSRKSTSSSSLSSSRPRTPPSAVLSPTESTKGDWQPFTIQPFRDEVSRVVRQYIAESAPRQLNLAPHDREACLRAAQHTTHPSSLLPAFTAAEANLRGTSHPNFIRWSKSNANRARVVFIRVIGIVLVLLGLGLDLVLILSRRNNFLRVVCIVLWWPGLASLIASVHNLCPVLHFNNKRQLRPWELVDGGGGDQTDYAFEQQQDENRFTTPNNSSIRKSNDDDENAAAAAMTKADRIRSSYHSHCRQHHSRRGTQTSIASSTSSNSNTDPLRKTSLQTFGPRNQYARDAGWAAAGWARRPLVLGRIFGETVRVQNGALQLLQDRAVFFAVLYGGLAASALTAASLFAPAGNMFL
ncbi:hypothetical protein B0T26DRAFT_459930 [Lasiosphaeria miniovina]|uniref:RGS domain-containing protein n=1 Tax=Lasiosphaeria miniovina TaxID=1954250 RepID=A0AA40DKH3_9PEZI|nr:uncharacterized protein B0T26DRAFT_459930 [Lasiosphaeria miniovina]KAK0706535.1 hypothetical protein B0T26DRAFT_459930 [Lasiosphaeria miniovina]